MGYVEDVGQLRALARFGYSCCLCVDATGVRPISSEGIFGGYHASCIFGSYQLPLATMRMPVIVMVSIIIRRAITDWPFFCGPEDRRLFPGPMASDFLRPLLAGRTLPSHFGSSLSIFAERILSVCEK